MISVQVIMLDTMLLCAGFHKCLQGTDALAGSREHWRWLDASLTASEADYLVVAGHHPVFSVGKHGSTEGMERLRPLLIKHRVSVYLSGHDHCQQALDDCGVHHHGIGSGVMLLHKWARALIEPETSLHFYLSSGVWPVNPLHGGFGAITFSAQKLVVTHYDHLGTVLHNMTKPPRFVQGTPLPASCQEVARM